MSVYVKDFKPGDGSYTVVHDDAPGGAHSGAVNPSSLAYGTNADGSTNFRALAITCPVCGAVSTHPVGGGAQPASVQQMFVRYVQAHGCPCGSGTFTAGKPWLVVIAHVRAHAEAQDYPGRYVAGNAIS